MSELIVSVSGIRGIPGDSLTPQAIVKYVSAFAEFIKSSSAKKAYSVVIGRDGRLNGGVTEELAATCLAMSGITVLKIGVAPTPTVQIAAMISQADGAISVTASHNPQMWNGLKFLNPDGTFLDGSQVSKLITLAEAGRFSYVTADKIETPFSESGWTEKHIREILKLKLVNRQALKKREFTVVVDAVNSSGSEIVPNLLEELGCKVIRLYTDGSGIFPHNPEPLPGNLKSLSRSVKKHKADLGIAVDPDADRLVLITDSGAQFGEENTITAAIRYVFRKARKKIATVNLSTTRSVDDVAKELGGKVYRSPVGEINVVKEMKQNGSVIGGEGSGGVILPASHYGRDSLVGTALILSELAESGLTADRYKDTLPRYFIAKSKIENVKNADKVLQSIKASASRRGGLTGTNTSDGLKLDFEDYWVHLRKSNTEPIIRIITEARSARRAADIQASILKEVSSLAKH